MKLKILGIILLGFLITGCAVKLAPMSKKVQANINTIDTTLIIKQSNLDVTVSDTDGSSGGLIGVLVAAAIDAGRRSVAEKESTPILKSLEGYDFRQVMLQEATSSLENLKNIKTKLPINMDKIGSRLSLQIEYDKSTNDGVLICLILYRLESKNLIATLHASLYPKATKLKEFRSKPDEENPYADGNAIYNNKFIFVKEDITTNNIVESLNEAAKSLANQLATDIDYGI